MNETRLNASKKKNDEAEKKKRTQRYRMNNIICIKMGGRASKTGMGVLRLDFK